VAAAPVAALVAKSYVAEAVVDAPVVADVRTPIAAVEAVAIVRVAPVSGRPECALVGSLHPSAGNPIVAIPAPGPVTGRPQVVVAGRLGLIIDGQWRRRLRRIADRLRAVARIVVRLIRRLTLILVRLLGVGVGIGLRTVLLVTGGRSSSRVRALRGLRHVGRSRIGGRILCACLIAVGSHLILALWATCGEKHDRRRENRQ